MIRDLLDSIPDDCLTLAIAIILAALAAIGWGSRGRT